MAGSPEKSKKFYLKVGTPGATNMSLELSYFLYPKEALHAHIRYCSTRLVAAQLLIFPHRGI
jgi:hypothetical protein